MKKLIVILCLLTCCFTTTFAKNNIKPKASTSNNSNSSLLLKKTISDKKVLNTSNVLSKSFFDLCLYASESWVDDDAYIHEVSYYIICGARPIVIVAIVEDVVGPE